MKIDSLGSSSSYYYQLLASQKSSEASSTKETESLASLLSSTLATNQLSAGEQLTSKEGVSSELDIESLLTQMNGDQQAMFLKMKMHAPSEEMEANRLKMDKLMESVAQTDLTSLSLDEKKDMLSEVVTQMSTMHGQTVNTEQIDSLSESEVTSILTDVKTKFEARQTEMAQGGVRPSGPPPNGPRPSGPPPSGNVSNESSSSVDDDDEITTLEALLEALAADEDEETSETEENEKLTQLLQNAIDQYLKNQTYGIGDLDETAGFSILSGEK